jgi:hypothetical protein
VGGEGETSTLPAMLVLVVASIAVVPPPAARVRPAFAIAGGLVLVAAGFLALIGALGAVVYRAGMPVPGPAGDTLAAAVDHRPVLPPQALDRAIDAFTPEPLASGRPVPHPG